MGFHQQQWEYHGDFNAQQIAKHDVMHRNQTDQTPFAKSNKDPA
jgi:hypothetical protein